MCLRNAVPRAALVIVLLVLNLTGAGTGWTGPGPSASWSGRGVQLMAGEKAGLMEDGPDPRAFNRLLENEREFQRSGRGPRVTGTSVAGTHRVLVLPVEFAGTQTFGPYDSCLSEQVTIEGPLHNTIPHPAAGDNGTFWVPDFSASHYQKMLFDTGAGGGIGVIRRDLYGGTGIDLSGLTLANYYLEQSEGAFRVQGDVLDWVQVSSSVGEYGADTCEGSAGNDSANGARYRLAADAADALNVEEPGFDWYRYDGDKDGYVDHLMVVHAGMGQDFGTGLVEHSFQIWSHRGQVDPLNGEGPGGQGGHQVAPPKPGYPDGVWVKGYAMMPENGGLGVFAHEFGHDLGLPDVYSNDIDNSTGIWDLMSSGSWLGKLPGTWPPGLGLWERWQLGWADPVIVDTGDPAADIVVGQAAITPQDTEEGTIVNLPDQAVAIADPPEGEQMWWGSKGNLMDNRLGTTLDLSGKTAPITLAFQTLVDMEPDFDYGYVEVSTDGGQTWTPMDDVGDLTTTTDPNGSNLGNGITGSRGWAEAQFDLSPYAGQSAGIRFRYVTDPFVAGDGWFIDDIRVSDASGTFFSDGGEAGEGAWTASPAGGWVITDGSTAYPQYYLVEWRNYSGFDEGLRYVYNTVGAGPGWWQVEPLPATAPGMLVWYRNGRYDSNYDILPNFEDSPSWGPKGFLLLVDAHPTPMKWPGGYNLSGREQTVDAAFTLGPTVPLTITDRFSNQPVTFASRSAASAFHDNVGYYPGDVWQGQSILPVDQGASAVLPAEGNYSVRISSANGAPYKALWGTAAGAQAQFYYGAGDPGLRAHGVHIAIIDQAVDGSWGKVRVYRDKDTFLGELHASAAVAHPGETITYSVSLKDTAGAALETGVPQTYAASLSMPVPDGATYVQGSVSGAGAIYDAGNGSIEWAGMLGGSGLEADAVVSFQVRVHFGTEGGTLAAAAVVSIGAGNHQPARASYQMDHSMSVWASGNVDCDGDVDSVDSLKTLRHVAGLSVPQGASCPELGWGYPPFGDADCDGDVDTVDALRILRHVAGLPNSLPDGCGPIGG